MVPVVVACLSAPVAAAQSAPAAAPTSQDARMKWFREAKFGLFIHWGLYAIPAGEWKGQPVAGIGEWIMNRAQIPVKEYEQLAAGFNPVKFSAEEWVQMAEDAGMKYIVITSKHHDGFAMYHSTVTKYNIFDATPFHRDPLKELSAACARHGIKFGFYYSQAQDWHEPNGAGNTWDFGPDDKKDFDQYLRGKAEPQVKELLTGYGPVCLIWFDTPRMMNTGDRAQRFIDILHS
jgi:alpha-L-fucosidase